MSNQVAQIDAAHKRIDLLLTRMSHIEQYLGMRHHKFPEGEQMWDFNQVMEDVTTKTRPSSLFHKKVNNVRRIK